MILAIAVTSLRILFFVSVGVILYTYLVYPLSLWIIRALVRRRPRPASANTRPLSVAVIIAAHNEEDTIVERIVNAIASDGAVNEVVIGSDGSTDSTAARAEGLEDDRVIVLSFQTRRGKALTLNDCVLKSRSEILIFTDARTRFESGFVESILRPFAEASTGMVVGQLAWRTPGSERSVGLYWRFELLLRSLESSIGLLAVATGACMAVRRTLYRPLSAQEDPDFSTPLDVVYAGFRVKYAADARATDEAAPTLGRELSSRSRMVARNLVGTLHKLRLSTNPAILWAIVSHKLLRWVTPFAYAGVFVGTLGFLPSLAGWTLLCIELAAAMCATIGWMAENAGTPVPVFDSAARFAAANVGMGLGVWRACRGIRITHWEPGT